MTDNALTPRTLRERVFDLATEAGATFAAQTFEGGQYFTVTKPGIGSVRVAYEWGDDEQQIIEIMREKMDAAGMLAARHEFLLDFGGGRSVRIWARDEREAVRIAMQGEPEEITDLTTGESKAWVSVTGLDFTVEPADVGITITRVNR